ncbi:LacI family DNA-binding transcriptional regulator [Paraglaciecola arctica]|uniref:LacI family transcriptional regulator, repressor for deo operon, udp, cdd, tsx, nupC, and nupG n=1 Tax=Paraglaciecola arctica BSs20135 TaxID=493475 RepID=K6YSY0_9ALTE|nr:LacI family DNA-binding transcriptional regulator [Paraglaciecola arctica]GAC19783.1 LacI family transcriptional regulator, repressor for deo operon, udp, cdd, tsx, nupC, and nupG [Paraglaciecola arctica BSs20135]
MAILGIRDIAALANVSPATVSRVFSTPEMVSKKTLNKVQKIIDEVGYRPNRMGASLRTRKSGNIVAIIPDITNPVNAGIIRAIEQGAQSAGYSVLLGDTQGLEEREQHYAGLVSHGQADGLLLFCSRIPFKTDPNLPLMEQLPPMVNGNERIDSDEVIQVAVDNVAAAKAAINYLISLGHKRIAAITGPGNIASSNERLEGYQLALNEAGIELDSALQLEGEYLVQSGMDCARQLLLLPQRPTAIFCFSDDMAIGVMKFLQKQGFVVPDDISVMGFDDINYAKFVTPSLTTVHQPLHEIGSTCIELLLKQLQGQKVEPGRRYLPFELKVRDSTGKAPE